MVLWGSTLAHHSACVFVCVYRMRQVDRKPCVNVITFPLFCETAESYCFQYGFKAQTKSVSYCSVYTIGCLQTLQDGVGAICEMNDIVR